MTSYNARAFYRGSLEFEISGKPSEETEIFRVSNARDAYPTFSSGAKTVSSTIYTHSRRSHSSTPHNASSDLYRAQRHTITRHLKVEPCGATGDLSLLTLALLLRPFGLFECKLTLLMHTLLEHSQMNTCESFALHNLITRTLKAYQQESRTTVSNKSVVKKQGRVQIKEIKDSRGEMLGTLGIRIKKIGGDLMSARDKAGLGHGDQMNKGVLSYENEVFQSVFVSRTSDIEDSHVNDRYAEEIEYQSKPSEYDARSSYFNTCESNCSKETHESMPEPVVNEPKVLVLLEEKGKLLLSPQQVVIGDLKDITGTKSPNTMVDQDYPQRALQNKGIVDSGCSRHMTGNKAYLAEHQDFNGGPVAFRGSKGYITGTDLDKKNKISLHRH
ncbi:hypothetical protein Tco_1255218 [Tanacetum coccineum]